MRRVAVSAAGDAYAAKMREVHDRMTALAPTAEEREEMLDFTTSYAPDAVLEAISYIERRRAARARTAAGSRLRVQTGFEAQRQRHEPSGEPVLGPITRRILRAVKGAEDIGQNYSR